MESDCRACLAIDESERCRRDTIVDSFHCDEIEETLCCIFTSDATCVANKGLLAVIGEFGRFEKKPFSRMTADLARRVGSILIISICH